MDETSRLPYPEWQLALKEAILEFDRDKLAEKALKAEGMILERHRQLQQSNDGHHERAAINDGLSILGTIKRDRLDHPDGLSEPDSNRIERMNKS
jgi:hypothetical protein